jgi:hypothetical protein
MKYKSGVAIEYQFVCDVVDATLEGHEISRFGQDIGVHTPEEGSTLRTTSAQRMRCSTRLTLPSAACAMHLRIVVFPAFGRPMISARNRLHLALILCVSGSIAVLSKPMIREQNDASRKWEDIADAQNGRAVIGR